MRSLVQWVARPLPGFLLCALLTGCSSLGFGPPIPPLPDDLPRQIELSETPFFPQEKNHCGPAALATLLRHRQIPVTPESLESLTYLPGLEGSLQIELAATARQQGVLVYPLGGGLNDLLREIAAGNPVLILQNQAFAWYPRWHYAVGVGYDLNRQLLILRSGRELRWITDFRTFMNTWNRAGNWGIVTLPPDRLPATATALPYLRAANDLALSGRDKAARDAYQTAVEAWPDNATAWLALGNRAYSDADWTQAVKAFQRAVELEPDNTTAWNNLAYALLADGQKQQALDALQQALDRSPDDANLRDSRQEILQRLERE